MVDQGFFAIRIEYSNLSVAGSIVMYDRIVKAGFRA